MADKNPNRIVDELTKGNPYDPEKLPDEGLNSEELKPILDSAEIEKRKSETPDQSATRLKDDLAAQRREMNSQNLLKAYVSGQMDLPTLHNELVKVHGNIKPAFEWLLANWSKR